MTQLQNLIQETKSLLKKEYQVQAQIIRNLQTLYDSRVHLKMKFSSFHSFCVVELEMDKSTAGRKLACLSLLEFVPDLPEQIEKGHVSATRAQALGGQINFRKKVGQKPKQREVENLFNLVKQCRNEKEVGKILFPQKQEAFATEIELDEEIKGLVQQAQSLTVRGDRITKREILKAALRGYIEQKIKEKDKSLSYETDVKDQEMPAPSASRYVPKRLEAYIWYRDQGKCTECGTTKNLEIDHIKPFVYFGAHTPENLRLLCRAHNLHFAKENGLVA